MTHNYPKRTILHTLTRKRKIRRIIIMTIIQPQHIQPLAIPLEKRIVVN
jgi:hypothetical protein